MSIFDGLNDANIGGDKIKAHRGNHAVELVKQETTKTPFKKQPMVLWTLKVLNTDGNSLSKGSIVTHAAVNYGSTAEVHFFKDIRRMIGVVYGENPVSNDVDWAELVSATEGDAKAGTRLVIAVTENPNEPEHNNVTPFPAPTK